MSRAGATVVAIACASAFAAGCGAASQPGSAPRTPVTSADGRRELIPPDTLQAGAVQLTLSEGERLAIFVVNAGGRDGATATLAATNVAAPASSATSAPSAVRGAVAQAETAPAPGDGGVIELARSLAPGAGPRPIGSVAQALSTPPPAHTSFCVLSSAGYDASTRRAASLAVETEHALVYVDDASADVTASDAAQLAGAFEQRIFAPLTALIGPPSDVDANGKVILLVTPLPGLWGCYWANDVLQPRDSTPDCTGTRSNAADVLYVAPPSDVTASGWTRADALGEVLPGLLAHELSHLLSYQRRCLAQPCAAPADTWVEEGLAKIAEDEAGYGWNVTRVSAVDYLTRTHEATWRGYDGRSLTRWENDSVGNYEGAHAFFRYYVDRLGPGVVTALASGAAGTAGVERALGLQFPEAVADVATALLFSGSVAAPSPDVSFTGAGWTPFADKLRRLDAAPLGPAGASASLRTDGWNAFVTGPAGAGGGTVTLGSDEAVKPWVAVVRFRGEL